MRAEDLAGALRSFKGAVILSFTCETVPAMKKTGNPYFGRLVKRAHVNGVIGWHYATAVNRQRDRERLATVPPQPEPPASSPSPLSTHPSPLTPHHFRAMPRTWGVRIQGTPLVHYEGKDYLEVKVQSVRYVYVLPDGAEVAPELVQPFLPMRKPSRQELEKEVILRDYRLDNITAMIWGGETIPITKA
jgi:hypothetical protein